MRFSPSASSTCRRLPLALPMALLSLCLPLLASAQSNASISIYGIADLGVRYSTGLTASQAPSHGRLGSLVSGANSTSRFGLRGSEDLGGGMQAIFNMEGGRALDTGSQISASQVFDRASYVGISGPLGSLTLGRQINTVAEAIAPVEPMGMRMASLNPNIANTALGAHGLGAEYGASGSTNAAFRVDNALKYSISRQGLTLRAMYSFSESATEGKHMGSAGAGLAYSAQGLELSAAFHQLRTADNRKLNAATVGTAYRWGAWRIAGNLGRTEAAQADATKTVNAIQGLGASWNLSPSVSLTAALYHLQRKRSGLHDDGFARAVFFAEYLLSKRSQLYAEFDHTRWRHGYQGAGNDSVGRGFTLGLKHSF